MQDSTDTFDTLLTCGGAARVLDCDPSTVRQLEKRGVLKCQRASNGTRLFRYRDALALRDERRALGHE